MDFGENVSARRELDTLCGLSKREKGDISEGRREVRLLAELPHDLRTRERCGEWVGSLELFLLLRISPVCVLGVGDQGSSRPGERYDGLWGHLKGLNLTCGGKEKMVGRSLVRLMRC